MDAHETTNTNADTHACTFDDALGCWETHVQPDPSGKCWFWSMDTALIMYFLKHMMITQWGPKTITMGIDVAAREMRLRNWMRSAKAQTNRVHAKREKLRKISLYWESIASVWLLSGLSQTCRKWHRAVKCFRETAGPCYMITSRARLERVLYAERKYVDQFRIGGLIHGNNKIAHGIADSMRLSDANIHAMKRGAKITMTFAMTDVGASGWSLLDMWNHGGGRGMYRLRECLQADVEKTVNMKKTHDCHVKTIFLPKLPNVPLREKVCEVTWWLVELPQWRQRLRR